MEKIIKFQSEKAWVQKIVSEIVRSANTSIQERGIFRIGLSGGNTPRPVYEALGELHDFPWKNTEIFLVDERKVPLDDERSNYLLVQDALINHLPESPMKFVFFDTRLADEQVLQEYRQHFVTNSFSFFDLLLLGLGTDGHTASLFPNSKALSVTDQWLTKTEASGQPFVQRYTLTYPALESFREIYFLLRGKEKADILKKVKRAIPDDASIPAAKIFHLQQTKVFYRFT